MGPNNTKSSDLVSTNNFNYNPVSGFSDTSGGGSNMGVIDMNNAATPATNPVTTPATNPVTTPATNPVTTPATNPGNYTEFPGGINGKPTVPPSSTIGGPNQEYLDIMPTPPADKPISGFAAPAYWPNQEYPPRPMTHAVDPSWYKTQQYMAKGGSVKSRPKGITKAQWHAHQIIKAKNGGQV
jgi:hypothetical protein